MKKSLTALVLATVFVAASPANAALTAMLTLKGVKSGEIRGSVIQKGREGKIAVIASDHEVKAPPGAKRQHGVYTITKEVDKATPLLYRAMVNGETMSFELNYWQPSMGGAVGGGQERLFYTVKLTNARISEIHMKMPNNKNPDLTRYAEFEEVSFAYDTIEWIFNDGNVTATDSAK